MAIKYLDAKRIRGSSTAEGALGTGLKAYYKFDESSGNIVNVANTITGNSTLGTGQNITMNGDPTYSVTGTPSSFGNAVSCDGSGDYGQFGTKADWNFLHSTGTTWTINVWLKFDATVAGNKQLIDNNRTADSTIGLNIRTQTDNKFRVIMARSVGNSSTLDTDNNPNLPIPTDNAWHMYTFRWDQSSGNGVLTYNTDASNEVTANGSGNGTTTSDCTDSLRLFSQSNAVGGELDAEISEMSIYNTVLTDANLTSLYNLGAGRLLTTAGAVDEKATLVSDSTAKTDNMTSDLGWTANSTPSGQGYDATNDYVVFKGINTSSDETESPRISMDLQDADWFNGSNLNDTTFTAKFKLRLSTYTAPSGGENRNYIGFFSHNSWGGTAGDKFVLEITGEGNGNKRWRVVVGDGELHEGVSGSYKSTDFDNDAVVDTDYYITFTKTGGNTHKVGISTNSDYVTGVDERTVTRSSLTGLRYFAVKGRGDTQGATSGETTGYIDDLYISNSGIPSSDLPENTIFEETDTRKYYFLQDNVWGESPKPYYETSFTSSSSEWSFNDSGKMSIDTSGGTLDFDVVRDGSNDAGGYDLGEVITSTKWKLRCSFKFTANVSSGGNVGAGNGFYFGLSDKSHTTGQNTSQDYIGAQVYRDNQDTLGGIDCDGAVMPRIYDGEDEHSIDIGNTTTTYYMQVQRTSSSAYNVKLWTGGYDGTLVGDASCSNSSGITGLRYIKIQNADTQDISTSSDMDIEFYEVKFWD